MPGMNSFHCRRQFCVSVAGFRPRSPLVDTILLPSYSTRTLHVLGRTDVIVVEERSKPLLELSSNKRVEWHDGGVCIAISRTMRISLADRYPERMTLLLCIGHFVPSKAPWRNFIRGFLRDPSMSEPAPGAAAQTPSEPAHPTASEGNNAGGP